MNFNNQNKEGTEHQIKFRKVPSLCFDIVSTGKELTTNNELKQVSQSNDKYELNEGRIGSVFFGGLGHGIK